MVDLSPATRQHVAALFAPAEIPEAEALLARECADNLPLLGDPITPQGLERLRFAALRLSGGRLGRLREAIQVAKSDWRDLLMGAGFAHDVHAHRRWRPRLLDAPTIQRWMAGILPEGVALRLEDAVSVRYGPHLGKDGAVIDLLGLEPEALYLVELASGEQAEEYQRSLVRQTSPDANPLPTR